LIVVVEKHKAPGERVHGAVENKLIDQSVRPGKDARCFDVSIACSLEVYCLFAFLGEVIAATARDLIAVP
jgi:hypothetical protein